MADNHQNQPPANANVPPNNAMQECSLALSNLRDVNGNSNVRGALTSEAG